MSQSNAPLESLLAVVTLAGLAAAAWLTDLAEPAFVVLAASGALLYLACYLVPAPMRRIISVPEAFHIAENWGPRGFDMQAVSYASYHTTTLAAVTHVGFALDAAAWLVLAWHFLGWFGVAAVALVKVAQLLSYQEPRLAMVLGIQWVVVATVAAGGWAVLGVETAVLAAMATAVIMAIWRTIGHVTEPVPPGVSGTSLFLALEDVGIKPSLGLSFIVGIVAEFSSGIPFRLLDVWTYDVLLRRLDFRADSVVAYDELDRQRQAIFTSGWGAAPATAHLAQTQPVS